VTGDEQDALLRFARASILAALMGGPEPPRPPGGGQGRSGGAFVTLRRRADTVLRGCIGFIGPDRLLVDVVADVAVGAALRDDRFDPVTAGELPELRVEISVLGPIFRVRPDEVRVGEMGLLVKGRGRQGVLLPQVPLEQGWDRETFLDRTCAKAGLPTSAWREPWTELAAFRCEVFGERAPG
jgi:AmmeMemoRadiSam system protein A